MSATNLTGNIYGTRQGSEDILHTYPINYNTTGIASAVALDVIKASATNPIHIEVSMNVGTAFTGGSTNVLTAGSTTTATEYIGASDVTETTAGYYPASNAVYKARLVSDTTIYGKYTQTGTAATSGAATLIVREYSENPKLVA